MNIILIKQSKTDSSTFQFSGYQVFLILFLLLSLLVIAAVYAGYQFSQQQQPKAYVSRWQSEIQNQEKAVAMLEKYSNVRINALTSRIAEMQGQLNRVNALGRRLLTMANIDSQEFNFDTTVAIGGPSEYKNSDIKVTELNDLIKSIKAQLESRELQLSVLEQLILNNNLEAEIFPSGQPIKKGWLSSRFGMRTDPFTGKRQMHKGLDFAGKMGTDILAVASGVVTWAGKRYGYGNLVEINHGNGYVTRYGHCKEVLVKEGDAVQKGSLIAKMGSTGRSTGPHVHFEVLKKGRQINPEKFLTAAK